MVLHITVGLVWGSTEESSVVALFLRYQLVFILWVLYIASLILNFFLCTCCLEAQG